MTNPIPPIRFKAKLLRPSEPPKGSPWTFLVLPKDASAKLPTRGMTTVEGLINGHPFRVTLEPDGQKSHWLKVNQKMREAAGAEVGDVVPIEILSVGKEAEPRVPVDLRKALEAAPKARARCAGDQAIDQSSRGLTPKGASRNAKPSAFSSLFR